MFDLWEVNDDSLWVLTILATALGNVGYIIEKQYKYLLPPQHHW